MSEHPTVPVCYRHPDRQTRLACSSCGRPVCVDCVQRASVGQLCPDCVAERGGQRVISRDEISAAASSRTPVAMTILVACVAVFAVGMLSVETRNLVFDYGAQLNRAVEAGEWYRLLSAAFLHASLPHILFNMLALYIFGPQLEREVGGPAFLSLYVGSALAGGAAFFVLAPTGQAVGASGAIFGLFGAWLAAAYRSRHTPGGRAGLQQLLLLLGINAALAVMVPGIAWEAHLGGLVAGMVIVWLWGLSAVRGRPGMRVLAGVAVGVASLMAVVAA